MRLNFEQIKSITTGAVRIEEENGKFRFYRFTEEQEKIYGKINSEQDSTFNKRCLATSGVRLRFATDSKILKLSFDVLESTSRQYFSFDIFVNGKAVGYIDNFSGMKLPKEYTDIKLPRGVKEKEFLLGDGRKEICVYFPWSVCPCLCELCLDDGAYVTPIKPDKKLLAFGDSITQGYDALRPSASYISRLADKLGAEELNKGIGGEIFFPDLAHTKDDFNPDYITVAYGTNDWSKETEEGFKTRCGDFFASLVENYPSSQIFAITPIWRKDCTEERAFGRFEKVEEHIKAVVADLPNVKLISGINFVPKDEECFADLRLHPNDEGFAYYADNLYREIL